MTKKDKQNNIHMVINENCSFKIIYIGCLFTAQTHDAYNLYLEMIKYTIIAHNY
jgi:hypothetical protein